MAGLVPHVVAWSVVATAAVFLAICRRRMAPDDAIPDGTGRAQAMKRSRMDLWGRLLVGACSVYALAIGAAWIYLRR